MLITFCMRPFLTLKYVLTGYHMVLNQPLCTFMHCKHGIKLNTIVGTQAISVSMRRKAVPRCLSHFHVNCILHEIFLTLKYVLKGHHMVPHQPLCTFMHSKHGVKLNTIVGTQAISVSMRAEESCSEMAPSVTSSSV